MEGHGIVVARKQDDLKVAVRYLHSPDPRPALTASPQEYTQGVVVLLEDEAAGNLLPPDRPGSTPQRACA